MDVKSAFLKFIKEKIFVKQHPDFENPSLPSHIFQLSKALYGWSKLWKPGMNVLVTFSSKMILKEKMLILLYLFKN